MRASLIADVRWSIRWTLILLVPVALGVGGLVVVFGGIESGAKVIYMVALAPMFALEPFTKGIEGFLGWAVFVIAEATYLFLIVLSARILWRRIS